MNNIILLLILIIIIIVISYNIIVCKDTFKSIGNIDLVYTWISGNDIEYNRYRDEYKNKREDFISDIFSAIPSYINYIGSSDGSINCNRLSNANEIEYSIKSVRKYIPWIGTIYIIMPKSQFNLFPIKNDNNIILVAQEEIIEDKYNPSFNSNAIELCFDNIPNLSNIFMYMNDDVIITKPIKFNDMYINGKSTVIFQKFFGLKASAYIASILLLNSEKSTLARANLDNDLYEITNEKTHYLISHAPIIIDKKLYKEIKDIFSNKVSITMNNKFRSNDDLVIPHYIYPHYAYKKNKAIDSKLSIKECYWTDNEHTNNIIINDIMLDNNYSFLLINDERSICNNNTNIQLRKLLDNIVNQ